jgi:hypothetical protein
MRKLALIVAGFLVSAQAPYVPTAPQAPILNVEISVTTQGGGKPAFYGTTNLPDGFEALAKLGETVAAADGRFLVHEDHFVVHAHHFTVGPFSYDGDNPFPSGTYSFSIIESPDARLQPESVRKAIGEDGSLMRGPLSAPNILGGREWPGRTLHFETQVVLR